MKFVSVTRELSKFEGFYCSPNTIKHRLIIENVQRRTIYSAHRLWGEGGADAEPYERASLS